MSADTKKRVLIIANDLSPYIELTDFAHILNKLAIATFDAGLEVRVRAVDEIGGCRRLESGVHGRIKRSVGLVCKARLSTARVSESVLLHVRITTWTG